MNIKRNKRLIVILGMHRSGTSAVARALQVLGVDLGDRLMPAKEDNNPKGFWEDVDINAFNIEILKALGSDWHYTASIRPEDVEVLRTRGYVLRGVELLRQKIGSSQVFGFKDPRTAKLLLFWKEIFDSCKLDVGYVVVVRHPLSVAKSLAKRDGFDAGKSHLLWLGHVITSLSNTTGDKCVLIDYDSLMHAPDDELHRLAECFDLVIDSAELKKYKEDFLDEELRHTVYAPSDLLLDGACPPIVREIYTVLLDVALEKIEIDDVVIQDKVAEWTNEYERIKPCLILVDRIIEQRATVIQSLVGRDEQIAGLNQAVHDKDVHINNLGKILTERDGQIVSLNQAVAERDGVISEILSSRSWRLTRPLRAVIPFFTRKGGFLNAQENPPKRFDAAWYLKRNPDVAMSGMDPYKHYISFGKAEGRQPAPDPFVLRNIKRAQRIRTLLRHAGGIKPAIIEALAVLRREGWSGVKRIVISLDSQVTQAGGFDHNDYGEWVSSFDTDNLESRCVFKEAVSRLNQTPLISILLPVYNTPQNFLMKAIESVEKQSYPNWELCIVDDASTVPTIRPYLEKKCLENAKIKVRFRNVNGHISVASNECLELVTGQYIGLLDHDDELAENALYWIVDSINKNPSAGLFYTDEDKLDESNKRTCPYFKPDWNPFLLLNHNYICHFAVYKSSLLREIGGFRVGNEGVQDYDLVARASRTLLPNQIIHIPRILYHWRIHQGSTAMSVNQKEYVHGLSEKLVNEHIEQIGLNGRAKLLRPLYNNQVTFALPANEPIVTIIIPTKNRCDLLERCISSIINKTNYNNYEIIIVDNGSDEITTQEYLTGLASDSRFRVIRDNGEFNYSRINNEAVCLANGSVIALLNNDIEIISKNWLRDMVAIAIQNKIGAVGAKLLYPDETIQHAGVVFGMIRVAGHAHKGLGRNEAGYFNWAQTLRAVSAVTAACLVIKKERYLKVGGLDEKKLPVSFNDIDLCLRLLENGYWNIYEPSAILYHHESASRGPEDSIEKQERAHCECAFMLMRWNHLIGKDPTYNPNLSLRTGNHSLSWPPRIQRFPNLRPKLVLVSHDARKGGAEVLILNLAKILSKSFNIELSIILLYGGPLESEFSKYGSVFILNESGKASGRTNTLIETLYYKGFHTALCNTVLSGFIAEELKTFGFRVVTMVHEMSSTIIEHHWATVAKLISEFSDSIIFASDVVKDSFVEIVEQAQGKSLVVNQGIFKTITLGKSEAKSLLLKKFNIPEDSTIFLSMGRGEKRKGIDTFLEIVETANVKNSSWYFIWVGDIDDPYNVSLISTRNRMKYPDRLIHVDYTADIDTFYAGSDVFLLPSRQDPFPQVVQHAMNVGLPIVAFKNAGGFVPTLREIGGVLVEEYSASGFINAMTDLLCNPDKAAGLSSRSISLFNERYNFHRYAETLCKYLRLDVKKVTVVIPNYNYGRYLKQRFASIVSQTYPIHEIIILDDNSMDNSVSIINELIPTLGVPHTLKINSSNKGCFHQWHLGSQLATGDFIWIAEVDDSCDSRFLERIVQRFSDPHIGMCYTQSLKMDSDGNLGEPYIKELSDLSPNGERWKSDFKSDGIEEICKYLVIKNTIYNASAVVIRRSLILDALEKTKDYRQAGDWATYIEVLCHANLAFIAEPLNYHRRHSEAITSRLDGVKDEQRALELLREIMSVQNEVQKKVTLSPQNRKAAADHTRLVAKLFLRKELNEYPELLQAIAEFEEAGLVNE
ncbi:MAG: glycosyltransferase [Syntrophales bacterium]